MIKPGSNYIKTASFNDLIHGTHIFLCLLLVIFFFVNKYLKLATLTPIRMSKLLISMSAFNL